MTTPVARSRVADALDCARCRALVTGYAPDPVDLLDARRADLGTSAAYAIASHYGRPAPAPRGSPETCPDCGRNVFVEERQNICWTYMPLDRDVPRS